jgi:hypothetical protein
MESHRKKEKEKAKNVEIKGISTIYGIKKNLF